MRDKRSKCVQFLIKKHGNKGNCDKKILNFVFIPLNKVKSIFPYFFYCKNAFPFKQTLKN